MKHGRRTLESVQIELRILREEHAEYLGRYQRRTTELERLAVELASEPLEPRPITIAVEPEFSS